MAAAALNLATKGADRDQASTPAPDDPRKPDSPDDLTKPSWKYVVRKTAREFSQDQCTDLAAALTYYAVLALFPAVVALVSLLGVVGDPQDSINVALDIIRPLVSDEALRVIEGPIEQISRSQAAGLALVTGLLLALWSASGYVGAFGRAMNRMYGVSEGRPFWKLRPTMLLVTAVSVALMALLLLMLVVSGPVAESIGDVIGLGGTAVTVWNLAKWPVVALVVLLIVALLYYATPNVKQPKFRWISVGAGVAILVWALASVAFAFYVARFSNYNATYGSLAGVVVALLFLWITNLALLFGAELDAELERGRQLQAGIEAERELQLPARDTSGIEKAKAKQRQDIALGRQLREQAAAGPAGSSRAPRGGRPGARPGARSGVRSNGRGEARPGAGKKLLAAGMAGAALLGLRSARRSTGPGGSGSARGVRRRRRGS